MENQDLIMGAYMGLACYLIKGSSEFGILCGNNLFGGADLISTLYPGEATIENDVFVRMQFDLPTEGSVFVYSYNVEMPETMRKYEVEVIDRYAAKELLEEKVAAGEAEMTG